MKKYTSLLLFFPIILIISCKKEAALHPLPAVADPYIRYDASNDLDHQIYLFYQQSNIPVLYTDTVAQKPLVLLNIGYHLTSIDPLINFSYLKSSADRLAGLNFIKNEIYPSLGSGLKPYSIFMVDTLFSYSSTSIKYRYKIPLNTYQSLTSLVIGNMANLKNMTPDAVTAFKIRIFQAILLQQLTQKTDLMKSFYAVSAAFYGQSAYGTDFTSFYIPWAPEESYGFLSPGGVTPLYYYQVPDQQTDLNGYLQAMLSLSANDFAALYGNDPLVMSKYNILRQIIITIGFKFS